MTTGDPRALVTASLPFLREGSEGTDVERLQALVNTVADAGLTEDGNFGPATDRAVRAFQASHHLAVDGIVGPQA